VTDPETLHCGLAYNQTDRTVILHLPAPAYTTDLDGQSFRSGQRLPNLKASPLRMRSLLTAILKLNGVMGFTFINPYELNFQVAPVSFTRYRESLITDIQQLVRSYSLGHHVEFGEPEDVTPARPQPEGPPADPLTGLLGPLGEVAGSGLGTLLRVGLAGVRGFLEDLDEDRQDFEAARAEGVIFRLFYLPDRQEEGQAQGLLALRPRLTDEQLRIIERKLRAAGLVELVDTQDLFDEDWQFGIRLLDATTVIGAVTHLQQVLVEVLSADYPVITCRLAQVSDLPGA
jgi:hypothetical protein